MKLGQGDSCAALRAENNQKAPNLVPSRVNLCPWPPVWSRSGRWTDGWRGYIWYKDWEHCFSYAKQLH